MLYRIKFDKENCRGCGACTVCDNWEMDDNGIAHPIKTELKEIGCNKDAIDICPVNIIEIVEQ